MSWNTLLMNAAPSEKISRDGGDAEE